MSKTILQGLVGAWCPSLGPSGYTLLDRSGLGRHGTLTNMDAGTDWVGSPGGWVMDYDGSNDYTAIGSANSQFISTALTLTGWLNTTVSGADTTNAVIASTASTGFTANFVVTVNFTGAANKLNMWNTNAGPNVNSATSVNTGAWIFWTVTRDASTTKIYINGREDASAATGTPDTGTADGLSIGRIGAFNGYYTPMQCGDIGIWHRTMTAPEVWQLWQMGQRGLGRLLTPQRRSYAFRVQTGNRRRRIICGAEC
jgi:hypothetical protein